MARLIVSTAVALAVTYVTGSPQAGFAAFSATYGLTGFLDPAQQQRGPRLDDLKGTTAQYGTPIPQVYGHPRVAGAIVWCSDKQTVENTESVGGKGGPSTEVTTYTYKIDVRILLSANVITGVRRVWSNGKLVWSAAGDSETAQASADSDAWERMTVYTGAADQMPDPVEEAALGIANCPAYRGRGSVFIEGLNLGGSGYLPNLTFEIGEGELNPGTTVTCRAEGTGSDFVSEEGVALTSIGYQQGAISSPNPQIAYPAEGAKMAYSLGACQLRAALSGTYADNGAFSFSGQFWFVEPGGAAEVYLFEICEDVGGEDSPFFAVRREVSGDLRRWTIDFLGSSASSDYVLPNNLTHPSGAWHLYEVEYDGVDTVTLRVGIGVTAVTLTRAATGATKGLSCIKWGDVPSIGSNSFAWDNFTATVDASTSGGAITPAPLEDVLEDLAVRSGLESSYLDFSSCAGKLVRALAVSQVTPARTVMQMLADANMQEFVESGGVLKTVARGGASVATIAYDKLGASQGDPVEPLPLKRLNDIELPRQVAVTYQNTLNDYQNGTEYSDRLLGGSTSVATTELALGMQPQEAKRLADFKLTDAVAGITQIGPLGLTREYARLEPTDVITPTDHTGSTYRARILKITDDGGLRTLECVLDDASAVNSEAVTDEDYESSTIVRGKADTDLELMDIPILRDVDNDAGIYAAVAKSSNSGTWPGAVLFRGVNDTGWTEKASYTDRTYIGETTTALAAWTGGPKFDEVSSVTVSGVGTLQNYTRDAILNGTANGYLIGSEVLFARTATLLSDGIYTLTGLLRGRRGTEWAAALGSAAGSRVVLLQTEGVRRVAFQTGELGSPYDFRAVTRGRSIGSALSESITPAGIGLKPFSPVNARAARAINGNITITWSRRTRLDCGFTGANGITVPLGESSESYQVVVYADDTFATVKRTLTATSETVTYTAAQQETDFGSVQNSLSVKIYQVSATVGIGYPLTVTLGANSGTDAFTVDPLNPNPRILLSAGDEWLVSRDGTDAQSLGFYTYATDLNYTSQTTQSAANPYLQSTHLAASDPTSKKFVILMRGTSNVEATRKLFYGTLPAAPVAVVPSFMPANPPVGFWWTGSEFRAILSDNTVWSSPTGAVWTSQGASSGLPAYNTDLHRANVIVVGSALALHDFATGNVYHCANTNGVTWTAATGDIATPPATYTDYFSIRGIATSGSRGVIVVQGKVLSNSTIYGLVYTTTDGQSWSLVYENDVAQGFSYVEAFGGDFITDMWPPVPGSSQNDVIQVHDFGGGVTLSFAYKATGTGGKAGATKVLTRGNGTTGFSIETVYSTSNLTTFTALDWGDA